MNALMTIVLNNNDDNNYKEVKNKLLSIKNDLSISPYIDYEGRKDFIIFNITMQIEDDEIDSFLSKLSNNFEGENDDCETFSQFSKMFDDSVDYISFYLDEK
ncbi:MAG: hypothetical protein PHH04_04660 [Thomasclavelia sp.]|nr:hypothetical protein [Thomasclavelia sp.]